METRAFIMRRNLCFVLISISFGFIGAFSIRGQSGKADCSRSWENKTSLEAWQTFFPQLDYPFSDRGNAPFRALGSCCLCCTCNNTEICQEYHITPECCADPTVYIACCTTDRNFRFPDHHKGRKTHHHDTTGCSVPQTGGGDG